MGLFATLAVFLITRETVRREIEARIDDEVAIMERVLRQDGETGLIDFVQRMDWSPESTDHLSGLFRSDGRWLAGDLRRLPPFGSSGRFRYDREGLTPEEGYYVRIVPVDDFILAVGRSDRILVWTERMLLPLLAAASLAGLGLVVLVMRWADQELGDDLDRLDRTLAAYVAGDEAARVPLGPLGERDSLQEIGRKLNGNLDALTAATATLRNTAAAVAHDLRRPLVRASLAIQAAAADPELAPDVAERIGVADEELGRLNQTFETILRIAALAHRSRESFVPVDLGELLREMAETFEPLFEDAGGRLDAEIPRDPLTVMGDREMLAQAFVNLIGNVLRHCPPGTSLRLSVGHSDEDIWAEIADDGPGVPDDDLASIFQPFERLDPSRHMDGAGLGLALVDAVARAHGAKVSALGAQPGLVVRLEFPGEPVAPQVVTSPTPNRRASTIMRP